MNKSSLNKSNFKLLSKSIDAEVDPMILFQNCESLSDKNYRILLESSEQGTNGRQQAMLFLGQALKLEARGFQVTISALNNNGKVALSLVREALVIEGLQTNKNNDSAIQILNSSADELIIEYADNRMIEEESIRVKRATPLDAIRQVLNILSVNSDESEKLLVAGVAGYDLVDSLDVLPEVNSTPDDFPDYLFFLADSQIILDQSSNRAEIRQIIFSGEGEGFRIGKARGNLNTLESILKETVKERIDLTDYLQKLTSTEKVDVYPEAEPFMADVGKLQDAIAKGQIFQTVISRQFTLDCTDPMLAYQFLKQQNPSPYQFYLQMGEHVLLGASPESSLRYQHQDRTISIMPIAGTRGRGKYADGAINEELDARLEADLKLDEKELAEHLMLVDLARNDLARIAETGSRKVRELMSVYRYSAVMHMVSRIDATLRSDLDIYHACQSCFHMGTLTGAPKKEAMILIRQLEKRRRGVYGGAVGYFSAAGDMDTAIVIRSALVRDGQAVITAGAGVVADSVAENELKETELKAAAVIRAIQLSELKLSQSESTDVQ